MCEKTKKNILEQLFDGEIFPSEEINESDPKSRELTNAISAEREHLSAILSDSEREHLDKLNALHNESAWLYGYHCFAYGFRLGAKILIEVLDGDKIESKQTDD